MSGVNARKLCHRLLLLSLAAIISFFCRPTAPAAAEKDQSMFSLSGEYVIEDSWKRLMWTKERSRKFNSEEEARQYLAQLNTGDFDNWRFPTKSELHDFFLVFDLRKNGDVKIPIEGYYWLEDEDGEIDVGAWEIGDGCGPERHFHTGKRGHVRAVRP